MKGNKNLICVGFCSYLTLAHKAKTLVICNPSLVNREKYVHADNDFSYPKVNL